MSIVLVVVLGLSSVAFLGCFFVGLCRERRRPQLGYVEEVIREFKGRTSTTSFLRKKRTA
jgi:hypothetical protein